jgi:hypothetical protein
MRLRGVEPPRPLRATRPSTLRVYQFRHSRSRAVDDSRPAGVTKGGGAEEDRSGQNAACNRPGAALLSEHVFAHTSKQGRRGG